jgi:hypothetical protein
LRRQWTGVPDSLVNVVPKQHVLRAHGSLSQFLLCNAAKMCS